MTWSDYSKSYQYQCGSCGSITTSLIDATYHPCDKCGNKLARRLLNLTISFKNPITQETSTWQQPTLTKSEPEVSYSHGISELEKVLNTIRAQHLALVGISSNLLTNSQQNTGIEILQELAAASASFANLQTRLARLLATVRTASHNSPN